MQTLKAREIDDDRRVIKILEHARKFIRVYGINVDWRKGEKSKIEGWYNEREEPDGIIEEEERIA